VARGATCNELGHIWRLYTDRGHEQVSCARCYQHLSVEKMLAAYLTQHPNDQALQWEQRNDPRLSPKEKA
jgi:hypothetical protein